MILIKFLCQLPMLIKSMALELYFLFKQNLNLPVHLALWSFFTSLNNFMVLVYVLNGLKVCELIIINGSVCTQPSQLTVAN